MARSRRSGRTRVNRKLHLRLQYFVCGVVGVGTKFGTDSFDLLGRKDGVSVQIVSGVRCWNEVAEAAVVALQFEGRNTNSYFY